MPTPLFLNGFENRVLAVGGATDGFWNTLGTLTAITPASEGTIVRGAGSRSLKLAVPGGATTSQASMRPPIFAAQSRLAARFYFRKSSNPSQTNNYIFTINTGTPTFSLALQTDGSLQMRALGGSTNANGSSSAVLANDTWYCIDVVIVGTTTAHSARVWVDGVQVTTDSTSTGAAAASMVQCNIGKVQSGANSTAFDMYFDDLIIGIASSATDRFGPTAGIVGLIPNEGYPGTPASASFTDAAGSTIHPVSNPAWDNLDGGGVGDLTQTAARVAQPTIFSTDYCEVGFTSYLLPIPSTTPIVQAEVALNSSGAGAFSASSRARNGATETVVFTGDWSTGPNSKWYKRVLVPCANQAELDGLSMRIGYGSAQPDTPYWEGLMFEVDLGPLPTHTRAPADTFGLTDSVARTYVGPYDEEVLADSPVAYWRLGASPLGDESGNANTLTASASAPSSAASLLASDSDGSRDFSGSSQYYTALDSASLSLSAPLTIEAWLHADSISGIRTIVRKDSLQFALRNNGGTLEYYYDDGAARGVGAVGALSASTLLHVAVTDDGTTVRFYVNGVQVHSAARPTGTAATDTSGRVALGATYSSGSPSEFWDGRIDEVALYGTALSAGRILVHYIAGTSLPPGTAHTRTPAETFGLTDARAKQIGKARAEVFGLTDARTRTVAWKRTRAEVFGLTDARAKTHVVVQPDGFGLTDARTFVKGKSKSLSETFGLTDAEKETRGKRLSETFGLTDARTRLAAFKRTATEVFGLSDLATPVKTGGSVAHSRTPADGLALTDQGAVTWTAQRSTVEQLLLTDSLTRTRQIKRAVADGFGLTDARRATHVVVEPDVLGLTDARARVVTFHRTRTETFALTDAQQRAAAKKRTVADGLALTDLATPVKSTGSIGHTRSVPDALALTDAESEARGKWLADTYGLTDAERETRGKRLLEAFGLTDAEREARGKRLSDALSLTDARTRVVAFKRAIGEPYGLTDVRRATHVVVKPETFGLTDARTRTVAFKRTQAENFGLTDARARARGKRLADGFALTDAERESRSKRVSDTLGLTDARARIVAWKRSRAEVFGLTDQALTSGAGQLTLGDSFGLTDARTRVVIWKRSKAEVLGLTDARAIARSKRVSDTLGLTDARTRTVIWRRSRSETYALSDLCTPVHTTVGQHVRVVPDLFGLTDARTRRVTWHRTRTDSFGLSDQATRARVIRRTKADSFGLTDSAAPTAARIHSRSVADSLAFTDTQTRTIAWKRSRSDSFALTDAPPRVISWKRTLADSLTLTDARLRIISWKRTKSDTFFFEDFTAAQLGEIPSTMAPPPTLADDIVGDIADDDGGGFGKRSGEGRGEREALAVRGGRSGTLSRL